MREILLKIRIGTNITKLININDVFAVLKVKLLMPIKFIRSFRLIN